MRFRFHGNLLFQLDFVALAAKSRPSQTPVEHSPATVQQLDGRKIGMPFGYAPMSTVIVYVYQINKINYLELLI